jgi:hypothetical protein
VRIDNLSDQFACRIRFNAGHNVPPGEQNTMSSLIVTKSAVSGYVCARRSFGKATIQVVSRPIVLPLLPVLVVAPLPAVRSHSENAVTWFRKMQKLRESNTLYGVRETIAITMLVRSGMPHEAAASLIAGW